MTPRAERRVRRGIISCAVLFGLGAAGFSVDAFLLPQKTRPVVLEDASSLPNGTPDNGDSRDLAALARQKMTKTIVKVVPPPPPPPPKPPAPPLDSLVRLTGVIDFGDQVPKEAFIETRQNTQTRAYKPGDTIGNSGAMVKTIGDYVIVEYDGKLWKLTPRSAELLSADPVGGPAKKN